MCLVIYLKKRSNYTSVKLPLASRAQKFCYEKRREFPFKHSVMGLCKTQLTGNGAYDLVVLTLNGLSIWQYCPQRLAELVNQRFEEKEQMYLEQIASTLEPN
jgi:hypothetical protein